MKILRQRGSAPPRTRRNAEGTFSAHRWVSLLTAAARQRGHTRDAAQRAARASVDDATPPHGSTGRAQHVPALTMQRHHTAAPAGGCSTRTTGRPCDPLHVPAGSTGRAAGRSAGTRQGRGQGRGSRAMHKGITAAALDGQAGARLTLLGDGAAHNGRFLYSEVH